MFELTEELRAEIQSIMLDGEVEQIPRLARMQEALSGLAILEQWVDQRGTDKERPMPAHVLSHVREARNNILEALPTPEQVHENRREIRRDPERWEHEWRPIGLLSHIESYLEVWIERLAKEDK